METLTIVFDLDDTLIHSHHDKPQNSENMKMINVGGKKYWVELRKGMREILNKFKSNARIILYTASTEDYATEIIKLIEQNGKIFTEVFSRQHCEQMNGKYMKNINLVGTNHKRIICIDDNQRMWNSLENVYECKQFVGGFDEEFHIIEKLLFTCIFKDDVRDVIFEYTFCHR